jgi:uncharacterized protein (TIGR02266 family)
VTAVDQWERDVVDELNRIEGELQQEEASLKNELVGLIYAAAQLETRLKELRELAEKARRDGANDEGVLARLETMPLPRIDAELYLGATKTAREEATRLRREAHLKCREHISSVKQQLPRAAQQLEAEAKVVGQIVQDLLAKNRAASEARETAARTAAQAEASHAVELRAGSGEKAMQPIGRLRAPSPDNPSNRGSKRVKMLARIDLTSDNNFFNGFSSNISDGGLFIATVDVVPIGTEVDVTFTIPPATKIDTKGIVRWVRAVDDKHPEVFPGVGIQFLDLDEPSRIAVEAFVAEREPLFVAE